MKYWKYLKYFIRHKYYVMCECFKAGIYWRGITHDLSKFLPSEFIPYANYFYGEYPSLADITGDARNSYSGEFKETIQKKFNTAWLKHQKRNPHHWQYWILQNDSDGVLILDMPRQYALEMVCDWIGAGKAIIGKNDLNGWYAANKDNIKLSNNTREYVEFLVLSCSGELND